MAPDNGVRFWLPAYVTKTGYLPYLSDRPFDPEGVIAQRHYPNLELDGKRGFTIRGERWIADHQVIRYLVKNPGTRKFDPQEVVDKGFMSADEMREVGFDVQDKGVELKEEKPKAKLSPVDEAGIDLDTARKSELVQFASDYKLAIDTNQNKPELLADIKAVLEEQGW